MKLLTPYELDKLFRWPRGRAQRLARAGKLPCIKLPDDELRFDEAEVNQLLRVQKTAATATAEVSASA